MIVHRIQKIILTVLISFMVSFGAYAQSEYVTVSVSEWDGGSGYTAQLYLTPNVNVTSWKVVLTIDGVIDLTTYPGDIWGADIVSVIGNQYTIECSVEENTCIEAAGGTVNFGFNVREAQGQTRISDNSIVEVFFEEGTVEVSTCNPICDEFVTSDGFDNTTTANNIINTGIGGFNFSFNNTVTSYQSSTAIGATDLDEARLPITPLKLYMNDILFGDDGEAFHGLGYYGSSYGEPNTDKKRDFADIHIDGPVLYGFNGGALGVRQYKDFKDEATDLSKITEKVVLQWTPNLVVMGNPDARVDLRVAGHIFCTELWVRPTTWYDNVFREDYELMSFDELRAYLSQNSHLPDIPSEESVSKDGLSVGEYNALLLKKVEELTLYILQLEERMQSLENQE